MKVQLADGGTLENIAIKKWSKEPAVGPRELCPVLGGSLDGRRICRRVNTCICVAESLCSSPETKTLLIGYTPIQYKKLKKKKSDPKKKSQRKQRKKSLMLGKELKESSIATRKKVERIFKNEDGGNIYQISLRV